MTSTVFAIFTISLFTCIAERRNDRNCDGRGAPGYQARLRGRLSDGVAAAGSAPTSWRQNIVPTGASGPRPRASIIDSYSNIASIWLIGEDLPRETNRITLHPSQRERQISACRFPMSIRTIIPTTSPCRSTPIGRTARCINPSARREPFTQPPYPSTHNMGTNRMSEKPRDGVVFNSLRPDPRYSQPVRIRDGKSVHVQQRGKSHADHRCPRHSAKPTRSRR